MNNNKTAEITDIDFGNLSIVEIDFIEMERQIQRISDLTEQAKASYNAAKSALIVLAGILGISIPDGFLQIGERLEKLGVYGTEDRTTVIGKMQLEINTFKFHNEEIKERMQYLNSIIESGMNANGGWIYDNLTYNGEKVNYNDILRYNENLKRSRELAQMLNISEEEWKYMIETDATLLQSGNIFKAVEEKYNLESGQGEIFINDMLNQIQNDSNLSNREKAVQTALALNNICYQTGVKIPYVGLDYHQGYTLNNIVFRSDCSSYVSFLIKQGNSEIYGGGTGTLVTESKNPFISESPGGLSDLQPGDIIVRNGWGAPYDHTMFFLGYDENGNLICTDNYGGTESYNSSGTRVKIHSIDDLRGYKGYNVDYDAGNGPTEM